MSRAALFKEEEGFFLSVFSYDLNFYSATVRAGKAKDCRRVRSVKNPTCIDGVTGSFHQCLSNNEANS